MSKSLRHYKRRNNKTQRKRRSSSGGKQRNNLVIFNGNRGNLNELDALLNNPHVLALHSSNTCGHCKTFKPVWGKVIQRLNSDPALALAELDSDATAHMNEHHYRRHNYEVNGVPTIVYINKINNNKPVEFSGERTENAIIDWLNNQSGKRIKITIETEDKTPAVESFPEPVSDVFPESVSSDTLSNPVSDTLSSDSVSDTLSSDSVSDAVAAFPPPAEAPAEAPTSVVGTIKNAASSVDNAIGSTVEKAKNALTQDIDLSGLFSSDANAATAATAAPAVTPAPAATAAPAVPPAPAAAAAPPAPAPPAAASLPADFQQAPIQPVPQVPSLGGKKRKITRRKKSKKSSSKKTKKSKK